MLSYGQLVELQWALLQTLNFLCNDCWVPFLPQPVVRGTRLGHAVSVIERYVAAHRPAAGHSNVHGSVVSRRNLAQIVACGYQLLAECVAYGSMPKACIATHELQVLADLRLAGAEPRERWIGELARECQDAMSHHLKGAYVHGSLATGDHCAYSDCDTLLILREKTVLDADRLLEFQHHCYKSTGYLYLFDPYQHHGHMMMTEIDQRFYPRSFLPMQTLHLAVRMAGEAPGRFVLRDDMDDRERALSNVCTSIIGAAKQDKYLKSKYYFKTFCSWVMLSPVLVLQLHGEELYKREAIAKARQCFEPWQWEPVAHASAVREAWCLDSSLLSGEIGAVMATHVPHAWRALRGSRRRTLEPVVGALAGPDFMEAARVAASRTLNELSEKQD